MDAKKQQLIGMMAALAMFAVPAAPATDRVMQDGMRAFATMRYDEAIRLLLPAAKADDLHAQTLVGRAYVAKAVRGQNDARSGYSMSLYNKSGPGSPPACRNPADGLEGERWLKRAARFGSTEAGIALVTLYRQGACGIDPSPAQAADWNTRTVRALTERADGGDLEAQYQLGSSTSLLSFDDDESARRWLTRAAEGGHHKAQHELGFKFILGSGVSRDVPHGIRWIRRAAEGGYEPAQIYMAYRHLDGKLGVSQDTVQAFEWYAQCQHQNPPCVNGELDALRLQDVLAGGANVMASQQRGDAERLFRKAGALSAGEQQADLLAQAASRGYVQAQADLASMLREGRGVAVDRARAATLYRQAAEQGHRESQFRLAQLNEQGYGVARNLLEALRWYRLAARHGHHEAQARLATLEKVWGRTEMHVMTVVRPGRHQPELEYCAETDERLGQLGKLASSLRKPVHGSVSGVRLSTAPSGSASAAPARRERLQDTVVDVSVARRGRALILVLDSAAPVTWHLKPEPGVVIQQVIVTNTHQQFTGLPPDVPVTVVAIPSLSFESNGRSSITGRFGRREVRVASLLFQTGLEPAAERSVEQAHELSVADGDQLPWYTRREQAELHAVVVSRGVARYQPGCTQRGKVVVDVLPTTKPLVLSLHSANPVTWQLRVARGVRMERVLVFGVDEPDVRGLPAGVPVIDIHETHGDKAVAAARITALTGLDVETLQYEPAAVTEGLYRVPLGVDGALAMAGSNPLYKLLDHPRRYLVEEQDVMPYSVQDENGREVDPATVKRLCIYRAFGEAAAGQLNFVAYKRSEVWLALEWLLSAGTLQLQSGQGVRLVPVGPRGYVLSSRQGSGYAVALPRPVDGCGTLAMPDRSPGRAVRPVADLGPLQWTNEREQVQQQLESLLARQRQFSQRFHSNVEFFREDEGMDYSDYFDRASKSGRCFADRGERYCYREYFQLRPGGGIGLQLLFRIARDGQTAQLVWNTGSFSARLPSPAEPWLLGDIDGNGQDELVLRSRLTAHGVNHLRNDSEAVSISSAGAESPASPAPDSIYDYQVIPGSVLTTKP